MECVKIVPGMIITIEDNWRPNHSRTFNGDPSRHFNLVISTNYEYDTLGYIQAMTITSMKNKEVRDEIPIVIDNKISYICPYNIHSFPKNDVNMCCYKGSLVSDIMSSDEFICFLMEIYHCHVTSKLGKINKSYIDSTFNKINDYYEKFNELYGNLYEYRSDTETFEQSLSTEDEMELVESEEDSVSAEVINTINEIDNLPYRYTQWSPDNLFTALVLLKTAKPETIANKSKRFYSTNKIKSGICGITNRIKSISDPFLVPCHSSNKISNCELFIEVPSGLFKRRVNDQIYDYDGPEIDATMRYEQEFIVNTFM